MENTTSATQFEAADPVRLHELCGQSGSPIAQIERDCAVTVLVRGATVKVFGPEANQRVAADRIRSLLRDSDLPDPRTVACAVPTTEETFIPARAGRTPLRIVDRDWPSLDIGGRRIRARTEVQAAYLQAMADNTVVFGVGPAGTGKTYLAVASAVARLQAGQCKRLIFARPAVEAGERLGFLPGDLSEKVSPYLRPLYDALYDLIPVERVERMIHSHQVEIAPLAFMRGRTLSQAVVILDEAQNTTPSQMKMFLTRLGQGSVAVVTGDVTQNDLPQGQRSGLVDALDRLEDVPGIASVVFSNQDIVRSEIVGRIIAAYDR